MFQSLVNLKQIDSLMIFNELKDFFNGTESNESFCLLTICSTFLIPRMEFIFKIDTVSDINKLIKRIKLEPSDFWLFNPNTGNCPIFATTIDAELTRNIYKRVSVLENEQTDVNPWGISFMTMFHMSNDSDLFYGSDLPLYEAKMLHQFDHRFGYYTQEMIDSKQSSFRAIPSPNIDQKQDPGFQVTPRYWVDKQEVDNKLAGKWDKHWLLAFRGITNATNERTAIFSLLPRLALGNSAPVVLLKINTPNLVACLQANFSSLVFDFVTRQKVSGTNFNFFIVKQLPVFSPEYYTAEDIEFISIRVLELVYTAWDMQPFAQDMGYEGAPFIWNEERRASLRAELDAKYAKLYGLTRDELRYILDPSEIYGAEFPSVTFKGLKKNELKEYGEYRTQRLVLAAWDLLESGGQMLSEVKTIEDVAIRLGTV